MNATNAIGTRESPLTLDQLDGVMKNRDKPPYGFFVSRELWAALADRFRLEANDPLAPIPAAFQGVQIAVDPSLMPNQFDVAFTSEAWSKRGKEIREEQSMR